MQAAILTLALTLLCLAAQGQTDPDTYWREIGVEEAARLSEETGKPMLISFASPVCLASHRMDNSTLADADLAKRIREETIPVRPPSSALPKLMEQFGVRGFPTLALCKPGKEPILLTGYWKPEQIDAWLTEPGSQIRSRDLREAPVGDVHDLAIDRMLSHDPAGAAEAMAVFWTRAASEPSVSPTLQWLRRDRYPSMLKEICKDDEARRTIQSLLTGFDADGPDASTNPALVRDWVVLTRALGDTDTLDNWIDASLKDAPDIVRGDERVFERLIEQERLADAGRVATETMWNRWLARHRGKPTGDPASDAAPARVAQHESELAHDKLTRFVAALRAAERNNEADSIESAITE